MKRLTFLFAILLSITSLFSQSLSPKSEIYIITCSPGEELYQSFGHNAIWIVDSVKRINYVYHYGTFDFSDPDFYVNFVRGKLNYMLGVEYYGSFEQEYNNAGRDVYAQKLNLDQAQKNEIFRYLRWKSLPENKYYIYDFLQDNCATRVRDVMVRIFGDTLVLPEKELDLSYRDVLKSYFRPMPWTRLKIINNNFEIGKKPWFNPTLVFWSLLVVFMFLSVLELKKKTVYKGVDFVLYIILGIIGILLLIMWFGTDHTPPKWNLNLLWAFPTHIWFAFVYLKNKKFKLIKIYSLIFGLLNIVLVLSYPIFPQDYDPALIPFFLLMGGRMLKRYWEIKKYNR